MCFYAPSDKCHEIKHLEINGCSVYRWKREKQVSPIKLRVRYIVCYILRLSLHIYAYWLLINLRMLYDPAIVFFQRVL